MFGKKLFEPAFFVAEVAKQHDLLLLCHGCVTVDRFHIVGIGLELACNGGCCGESFQM